MTRYLNLRTNYGIETVNELSLEDYPRFYIIDATNNDPAVAFVADEGGDIIHTSENCISFSTETEADEYIQKKSWQDWAGVIKL